MRLEKERVERMSASRGGVRVGKECEYEIDSREGVRVEKERAEKECE